MHPLTRRRAQVILVLLLIACVGWGNAPPVQAQTTTWTITSLDHLVWDAWRITHTLNDIEQWPEDRDRVSQLNNLPLGDEPYENMPPGTELRIPAEWVPDSTPSTTAAQVAALRDSLRTANQIIQENNDRISELVAQRDTAQAERDSLAAARASASAAAKAEDGLPWWMYAFAAFALVAIALLLWLWWNEQNRSATLSKELRTHKEKTAYLRDFAMSRQLVFWKFPQDKLRHWNDRDKVALEVVPPPKWDESEDDSQYVRLLNVPDPVKFSEENILKALNAHPQAREALSLSWIERSERERSGSAIGEG